MKKFSNITGQKVNDEPKKEIKQLNEEDLFKLKLIQIMDKVLSIRTYGPVDRHQRAGLIKIAGKEMLAEAILDLLTDKSLKDQTKLLEGLKSQIGEWEVLDTKIDLLKQDRVLLSNRNKFNSILEKYTKNDLLLEFAKNSSEKIKKTRTLQDYLKLITESNLTEDTKSKLSEIYTTRLNQLLTSE